MERFCEILIQMGKYMCILLIKDTFPSLRIVSRCKAFFITPNIRCVVYDYIQEINETEVHVITVNRIYIFKAFIDDQHVSHKIILYVKNVIHTMFNVNFIHMF